MSSLPVKWLVRSSDLWGEAMEIRARGLSAFYAVENGLALGSVDLDEWLFHDETTPYKPGEYRISRMSVKPPYQSKGIGTLLLTRACEEADRQKKNLVLEALPYGGGSKTRLISFYKKFGFKQIQGQPRGVLRREFETPR